MKDATNSLLIGGTRCDGIQMQKTATLMQVMTQAVPHFSLLIVLLCSAMMAMRLTIICISSWISSTQRTNIENKTGTLSRSLDSYSKESPRKCGFNKLTLAI